MKPSEYNLFDYNENSGSTIYNTITGAVISLNENYTRQYVNKCFSDKDFSENMKRGGFIIPDDVDEKEYILSLSSSLRNENSDDYGFTIAPTMSCNFRCPYCFEEGHKYNTMTQDVINKTIEYINDKTEKAKSIYISWYGGEPLLRPDIIGNITKGINREGKQYQAAIVTNGYFLDKEMAIFLKEHNVTHAQVTVDGPPDIHNRRRCLPDGSDTFFKILKNVLEASGYLRISIRVNIDKTNLTRTDEILDYLDQFGMQRKVSLYLAAVDDINGCCNKECLMEREFSEIEAEFYQKNSERGYTYTRLPFFNPGICGAVNKSVCVIDPLGDLYKCWNEIGIKSKSYGSIFSKKTNDNLDKWENYNPIKSAECDACKFLPICMGGCPYKSLNSPGIGCMTTKYNYRKFIDIIKKEKTRNR